MLIKNKLARAVTLALAYGSLTTLGLSGAAFAQDSEETEEKVEKIQVTGSRIQNANVESSSPVVTIESELFDIRGTTDTVDLLNTLPSFFASQTTAFANGATGTSTANLRGLGAIRTLVLVDGKRLPPGGPLATYAQDLNLIAPQLVDRVDVVTGGASAVYGSDAIGGVVNFITRKDFEGVEVDVQYGVNQSSNGDSFWAERLEAIGETPAASSVTDNQTVQVNMIMGSGFDDGRGNVTAYFNYAKNNGIQQANRDFSQCATFPTGEDDLICLGSNQGPYPTTFVVTDVGTFSLETDDTLTDGFTNAYNFNPFNPIRRATERFNIGFKGYYDIAEDVTAYADFAFTSSSSPQIIAPSAAFGSTINRVNCDNPVLLDTLRDAICGNADINGPFPRATLDPNGAYYGQSNVRRRFVEGGGRTDDRTRTNFMSIVGVRGVINDVWDWDLFAQYSETRLSRVQFNQVTLSNLQNALDIVTDPVTGNPTCRSVVDGSDSACIPFTSAYQIGIPSDPALVSYVDTPTLTTGTGAQTIVGGTISADLGEFDIKSPMADEGISFVAGFEMRRDELFQQADGIAAAGDLVGSGGATTPVNAETTVTEFFVEAQMPLISDAPGIEQLNLTTAYRYSDYESENALTNTVGGVFDSSTYAIGLAWVPTEDVRVRAQFQKASRAPNINELFAPQNSGLTSLTDPCSGSTPTASAAACANTGLSSGLYGSVPPDSGQLNTLTGGNPDLQPEESDTVTFGVVWTPSFVENLTISLDYFDISVEDAIGTVPTATTLQQCLDNGDPAFCNLIQRGPDGSLTFFPREQAFIAATNANIAEFATTGLDTQVMYTHDFGDYGELMVNYNATFLTSLDTITLPGTASFDCAGWYGSSCGNPNPEYRHNMVFSWDSGSDYSASLVWRLFGSTDLVGSIENGFIADGDDGSITKADPGISTELDAVSYLDFTFFYDLTENVRLRAGANNLLDKDPPIVTTFGQPGTGTNVEANTIAGVYDAGGRFMFAGVTVSF
ncbi:TonB-dependent receptor domain-containing protein [Glaciecola petra]|uniref:TonB-dependent receptor n=1 Tax=Glaciecola petra TaxID=3075602 RepID=A0ABU2ZTF8_9ALTE|nr:TonB-dependent receptor [Aestuariibacter sp. P117]MDT0595934.1 TonB-dependent receptor [Aestuariibacter sp. P117]